MNLDTQANNPVIKQVLFNFSNNKYSPKWYEENINIHAKNNQDGNPLAKRKEIYTGWTKQDFTSFFAAVEALKANGMTPGGSYSVQKIQSVIGNIFQASPDSASASNVTARTHTTKPAKLEPINRLTKSAQYRYSKTRADTVNKAQFLNEQPSSLELGNLALRSNTLALATQAITRPLAEKNVLNFLQGIPVDYPKVSFLWEKYIPSNLDEAHLEVIQTARETTKIDKLYQASIVADLLVEEAACALYDSIKTSQERSAYEHTLNENWKEQRPEYWNWANKTTDDFIRFHYPNNSTDADKGVRDEIRIARLAGFRALDAHFTGEQVFEGEIQYKKPKFQFTEDLDDSEQKEFDSKFGFIKLGKVKSVTYGVNKTKNAWHQKAMTECSFEASRGQDLKFQPDHFVAQLAADIHPIMTFGDTKAKQKGLTGQEFLAEINELARTSQNIQVARVNTEELEKYGLLPEDLLAIGINPMQDVNRARAGAVTLREIPEFSKTLQEQSTREALVNDAVNELIAAPLIASQEQYLMLKILEGINREAYMGVTKDPGITDQDKLTKRNSAFELAVTMAAKDQTKALNSLVSTRNIEIPKHQFQAVAADPRMNWKRLPESDTNNPEPNGWFLLKDHIKDMTKDGLSKRTIKMAGVYSVVDPEQAVQIVSRFGRSEVHNGMKKNGRLLVYPNPLIFFEQHSKTDRSDKKYVAPDGSCNPPLIVPTQAKFTQHNLPFLEKLNGKEKISEITKALKDMQGYEKEADLQTYISWFEESGFGKERSALLGKALFTASTSSKLYDALSDTNATIEITEGQKKTYKMYQSYKEQIEEEDKAFAQKLPKASSDAELLDILQRKPNRPNKLFICSPGVWMPVKSWRKFTDVEKAGFCESLNVEDVNGSNSPLNAGCKHALIPSWINMVDMTGRNIVITYDSDAQYNIGVTQSVSAMAQTIKDAFPNSRLNYRLIEGEDAKAKLGADDYLVKYGNKPFWDNLEVREVAPNVSWAELNANNGKSLIRFLVEKRAKMGDVHPENLVLQ